MVNGVPESLDAITERARDQLPDGRYCSAIQMRDALAHVLEPPVDDARKQIESVYPGERKVTAVGSYVLQAAAAVAVAIGLGLTALGTLSTHTPQGAGKTSSRVMSGSSDGMTAHSRQVYRNSAPESDGITWQPRAVPYRTFNRVASERHYDVEQAFRDDGFVTLYGESLRRGKSVVYVVDKSGSTGCRYGASVDSSGHVRQMSRLDVFISEVRRSVQDLPEHVRFGLVAYDRYVDVWAGEERAATGEAVTSADTWLNRMRPGGGSATAWGLNYALRQYPSTDTFILLTDGGPNDQSSDVNLQMVRHALSTRSPARVHVISLEDARSQQDFLLSIASMTNGQYVSIGQ